MVLVLLLHDECTGHGGAVSDWMRLLLPTAISKGVCIITNMGAGKI